MVLGGWRMSLWGQASGFTREHIDGVLPVLVAGSYWLVPMHKPVALIGRDGVHERDKRDKAVQQRATQSAQLPGPTLLLPSHAPSSIASPGLVPYPALRDSLEASVPAGPITGEQLLAMAVSVGREGEQCRSMTCASDALADSSPRPSLVEAVRIALLSLAQCPVGVAFSHRRSSARNCS
ncbi:hypothetical protein Micbo1qcDRAFT_171817 [Microdochium bolleyi]|uniref:Uncharacterized protein n=1 Tax=Microdochium bolleyi TaxID=196109 RepID=A0A136JEA9_9PEZI|nr:hypothetical protein Micbo1qcDRAFT_171817 [Microdochium bolleyi]